MRHSENHQQIICLLVVSGALSPFQASKYIKQNKIEIAKNFFSQDCCWCSFVVVVGLECWLLAKLVEISIEPHVGYSWLSPSRLPP